MTRVAFDTIRHALKALPQWVEWKRAGVDALVEHEGQLIRATEWLKQHYDR